MNKNQLFFHSVSFPRSIFSISSSWFQVHCIFFPAVMGLIFLVDVFFIVNFSMYPANKKINDLKLQKIIIVILFNKALIR